MRICTKLTIGILLVLFTSTSFAEGSSFRGMYFGGSFSSHKIKDLGKRLYGADIKVGYDLTNFLAIEGQFGGTITEYFILVDELGPYADDDLRVERAGIYARANWRLTNITLFGLVGYGYYNVIDDIAYYDGSNETINTDESGLSYGLGIELFGSGRTALSVSWMQLIKEKVEYDFELNSQAVFLGITHYFNPQKTTHAPY